MAPSLPESEVMRARSQNNCTIRFSLMAGVIFILSEKSGAFTTDICGAWGLPALNMGQQDSPVVGPSGVLARAPWKMETARQHGERPLK
jgi:hypothetical protein